MPQSGKTGTSVNATDDPDTARWKRLGELLGRARVELDPRYANRRLFCKETGINYRLTTDVENGLRDNYGRSTKIAIEVAYGWAPGSINRVLDGGDPSPADPRRRAIMQALPEIFGQDRNAGTGDGLV